MRKKSIYGLVTLLAGVCALIVISCNKSAVDSNTTTATDNALAEEEFMRLLPMVNSLCHTYKARGVERTASTHYPQVTVTDTVLNPLWPRTMTINYGTNTTDSSDHRVRSGIITVTFPYYWKVWGYGYKPTITFTKYSVTAAGTTTSITGTVYLEHRKDSTFIETVGGAILSQGAITMNYSCTRTFYWAQGHNDSVASHGVYNITGTGSGMDHNQVQYTSNITSQLVYRGSCANFVSGTMLIVPAGNANRTIDYGNGTCGGGATVSIDGNSYSLTLP